MAEVVCTKEYDKLCTLHACTWDYTEVEGTDSAGLLVQDVDTIPALLFVDQICLRSQLVYEVLHGFTIDSGQSIIANN